KRCRVRAWSRLSHWRRAELVASRNTGNGLRCFSGHSPVLTSAAFPYRSGLTGHDVPCDGAYRLRNQSMPLDEVFAFSPTASFQSVGDGAVVLLADSGQLYSCNDTSEAFLRHID